MRPTPRTLPSIITVAPNGHGFRYQCQICHWSTCSAAGFVASSDHAEDEHGITGSDDGPRSPAEALLR